MVLSADEKRYLRMVVERELTAFRKEAKTQYRDAAAPLLKAEHEYGHFLEALLKKLG